MSTIVDCPVVTMAMSATTASQLFEPVPGAQGSMAASHLDFFKQLIDGGGGAMTAGYVDHFVETPSVTMGMAATGLPITHLKDVAAVRAAMLAQGLSLVHELAQAGDMAMAATTFNAYLTNIAAATAMSMAATAVGAQTVRDLVKIGMAMVADISRRVYGLATATTMVMAADAEQIAHVVDRSDAGAMAMSSSIVVQAVVARQLVVAGAMAMSAQALALLHSKELAQVYSSMSATGADGLSTSQAWTAPTDTMAMSRYEHKLDLGIAASGSGGTLIFGSDGLFIRGGTTDDGEQIDMAVVSGLMDFKSEAIKYGDDLYFSFKSSRGLIVDVGETSTGAELTYSFPSDVIAATELLPWRIQVDRGIESRYRRYTIRNVDGDALSIRGFLANLTDMKRRF